MDVSPCTTLRRARLLLAGFRIQSANPTPFNHLCSSDQYIIDGYVNQFHDVSYHAHDQEAHPYGLGDAEEFSLVGCGSNTHVSGAPNLGKF